MNTLSGESPRLAGLTLTSCKLHNSLMSVGVTCDFKAVSTNISEVLAHSIEPVELLVSLVTPWSDSHNLSSSHEVAVVSGNCVVPLQKCSYTVGSLVPNPPLSVISRLVVLKSDSVVIRTNVVVPSQAFACWHC